MSTKRALIALPLGITALAGTLLPLATKGGPGVGIPVLLEFSRVSWLSTLSPLLYLLGAAFLILALMDIRGGGRDLSVWYLLLGVAGLAVTGISVMEAISHIALFGSTCTAVAGLRTATGPTGPGLGAWLLLFAYLCGVLLSLAGTSRSEGGGRPVARETLSGTQVFRG